MDQVEGMIKGYNDIMDSDVSIQGYEKKKQSEILNR